MNLIHAGSFLTLHYRLAGPDGRDLINTFAEKPATLSLGTGELAPAIEARLIGLAEGVRTQFELAPGEAFGERKPDMLQRVKKSLLDQFSDTGAVYGVGDVCSSPRLTGRALLPACCARSARTGSCSTSTTRWPASR
jgi:FKBP-type peptidyl-prolyl cis-trans isomerase SlpA